MARKLLLLVLILLTAALPAAAQEADPPAEAVFRARVVVDSAFVRALPLADAERVADVFEDNVLNVVGRNADGTWLSVHRLYEDRAVGWIQREYLAYTFEVAQLPITDTETGVTGDEPIINTDASVLIIIEANLRDVPSVNSDVIGTVALNATVPVLERSPDNLFLRVNYLGTVGWIAELTARTTDDLTQVPVAQGLTVATIPIEIIPPEVQLAQVQRLRDYIIPKREMAESVAQFWSALNDGRVWPCEPPADGTYVDFAVTQRDIVELPELRALARLSRFVTRDLNATLQAYQDCGVYLPLEISTAYAQAINATNISDRILRELAFTEGVIRRANNLPPADEAGG